jgi:alkaline phosphatase
MTHPRRISIRTVGLLTILALIGFLGSCDTGWMYPSPMQPEGEDAIAFYQPPQSKEPMANPSGLRPRNIILCIGDGMGVNQVALARDSGVGPGGRLWMETMPYAGLVSTHNASGEVTDSAAAITAILCGVKTSNKRLGQDADGTDWITLPERLREEGYRVGAAVTCSITHATPAGLAAHVSNRDQEILIAVQMFDAKIDVLFGGGRTYWLPDSQPGGARSDGRNLLSEAQQAGWQIVQDSRQMEAVSSGRVIGLLQDDALTTLPPEPSLAEMTQAALRILSSSQDQSHPFFLMVEGSQIDWAGHQNNQAACVRQALLFDMAVRAALEFAVRDQHTLVLVTADHETGDLTLSGGTAKPGNLKARWGSQDHSAAKVPIYAYGPGAQTFTGVLDNTQIALKIARLMDLDNFPRAVPKKRAAVNHNRQESVYALSGL